MRVREAATPRVMTLRLGSVRCEQDRRLGPGRPQWPAVDVARFEEVADRRGRRGIPAKRRGILAAVPIARPEGGRTFAPLCGGQSLLRLSESSGILLVCPCSVGETDEGRCHRGEPPQLWVVACSARLLTF